MAESKSVTKRIAHQKKATHVPEPEVIKKPKPVKDVAEGEPKWTVADVWALIPKLQSELIAELVPVEAYSVRMWPIQQMSCREVLTLRDMLKDYGDRLETEARSVRG